MVAGRRRAGKRVSGVFSPDYPVGPPRPLLVTSTAGPPAHSGCPPTAGLGHRGAARSHRRRKGTGSGVVVPARPPDTVCRNCSAPIGPNSFLLDPGAAPGRRGGAPADRFDPVEEPPMQAASFARTPAAGHVTGQTAVPSRSRRPATKAARWPGSSRGSQQPRATACAGCESGGIGHRPASQRNAPAVPHGFAVTPPAAY